MVDVCICLSKNEKEKLKEEVEITSDHDHIKIDKRNKKLKEYQAENSSIVTSTQLLFIKELEQVE